jgi:hypothetical protein
MLNLNSNSEYLVTSNFSSTDQQFYHNLYANSSIKDKNEFAYKNNKFDFMNNNSVTTTAGNDIFTSSTKDCENSKMFSVNNLLKVPTESSIDKLRGKIP